MSNNVNNEIITFIDELSQQKKVDKEIVFLSIEDAMTKAYEKEMSCDDSKHPELSGTKCEVHIDRGTGALTIENLYQVVDDATLPKEDGEKIYNDYNQILLTDSKVKSANLKVGDYYHEPVKLTDLPRRVVLHMLQVFKHDINIESNKTIYKEWIDKKGTIIYAEVEKIDPKNKSVVVNLETTYGIVQKFDQNPSEQLIEGSKYKFFVKDVLEQSKNWPIVLSRASGEIVKDLLANSIPEITNGTVSIVKVGRVAGFKTKVAVKSNLQGVDAVGSCIGARADRIKPILDEMGDEKIEFVEYSEDINKFLVNACNPAPLIGYVVIEPTYEINEQTGEKKELTRKKIQLIVDDYKLALIIGSKGKNVRVLSELFDADVEVVTYDEAKEIGLKFTKAEIIRKKFEPIQRKAPTNKFNTTYNKYYNTNMDVIGSIDQNSNTDEDTIVSEQPKEEIVQVDEKVDESDYADDIAAINELTNSKK